MAVTSVICLGGSPSELVLPQNWHRTAGPHGRNFARSVRPRSRKRRPSDWSISRGPRRSFPSFL